MNCELALLFALEREAQPFIQQYDLNECFGVFDERLHLRLFSSGHYPTLWVVLFGRCPTHGVERIGTQVATMAALETIRCLCPRMIASAGTAGGFLKRDAKIGDVFFSAKAIYFHGRHIVIPKYKNFELGGFMGATLQDLGTIKSGVISSSDSIPPSPDDMIKMDELATNAKDMEAAAIAEIAALMGTPMFALKAISDFVDSRETTHEQFQTNYRVAARNLCHALGYLIEHNNLLSSAFPVPQVEQGSLLGASCSLAA